MSAQILEGRKIPQSFGITIDQISKLQELSKRTEKSLSELARELLLLRQIPLGKVRT
jgi:hypothetical protein